MFGKMIKHEWRASRGVLGLLCLICAGAALVGGGAMRFLTEVPDSADSDWVIVVCAFALTFAILAIVVCWAGAIFYALRRFYVSRFTDEGYLTFTLPVGTHQNLLSSMVNTSICSVLATLAATVAMAGLLALGMTGFSEFWAELVDSAPRLWQMLRESLDPETVRMLWLILACGIVGFLGTLVQVMFCETLGAVLAKKHRLLTAVIAYFGIGAVQSAVQTFLLVWNTSWAGPGMDMGYRYFGTVIIATALFAVVEYLLMYYLLEKKLNLN